MGQEVEFMILRRLACLVTVLSLLFVPSVMAQEKGRVGITMGYPATIGFTWHVTDTVAFRPDISFTHSHSDRGDSPTESDTTTIGTGVAALFYFAAKDNVRPYFSPRVSYSHGSGSSTSGTLEASSHGNAWTTSGSFGAQYSPNRRFSV